MRIFYITHTYSLNVPYGGGGEVYCETLLKELAKRGHEILVFTTSCRPYNEEKKLGIKVYRSPSFGHSAFHKFQYTLDSGKAVELARSFKPDIVHAQNDVFPGFIAERIKKELGIPYILGIEYISKKAGTLNQKLLYYANKLFLPRLNPELIVSMSHYNITEYLSKWGLKKKIIVIPVAADASFFKKAKPDKKLLQKYGKHLIISIKTLNSVNAKGMEFLIHAMKIVSKTHPEFKLLIVGDGPGRKMLEELVPKLGLQKTVFLLGAVPHTEIPKLYKSAEIVAYSFAFEATTSMSLIDALTAGKTIVVSEIGEVKNAVENNAALLVQAENAESIAEGISKLIENPKLRKEFAKKALALAKKRYSVKAVADAFEKVYQQAIKSSKQ